MKRIYKILIIAYILCVIATSVISVLSLYPYYLFMVPKTKFVNDFYGLTFCSFIIDFRIKNWDVCAYYRVFTCEENYKGNWELESFDRFLLLTDNSTHFIIKTYSHLLTENLIKTWTFFKGENYFLVNITKEYFISDFNMNNQIIIDVQNSGYSQNDTENRFTFYSNNESLTFQIFGSNTPISIQFNGKTELQINFNDQKDHDLLFHNKGDVETVLVKVIID